MISTAGSILSCNVCKENLAEPIYKSVSDLSITSLCQVWPVSTRVFYCENCGHVQTPEETDLDEYYMEDYKILIDSEDEDQIYEVCDGKNIYRTEHQVETFFSLVTPREDARILDFGCAKSATLRKIVNVRQDIIPHLFDVSDMYIPFWKDFVEPENWAIQTTENSWEGYFDVVTSFFSLEHAADAQATVRKISSLLKDGGLLYAIVPNIFTNVADLVVVDHVNHFTETSLRFVLLSAGFSVININCDLHTGAFVVLAEKNEQMLPVPQQELVESQGQTVNEIVSFWEKAKNNIQEFEKKQALKRPAAIYGSGFYGTFIGICLQELANIDYVVDQNPYLQGKLLFDKPIGSPEDLPPEVEIIYVGLNPRSARDIIRNISIWKNRDLQFFFM